MHKICDKIGAMLREIITGYLMGSHPRPISSVRSSLHFGLFRRIHSVEMDHWETSER